MASYPRPVASGELEVGRRRPALRGLELGGGAALRWPLWQVGLLLMIFSLLSFPQDLATGQADGAWGTLSVLGLPGILAAGGQGPLGHYVFYSTAASLLLSSGAIVAAAGGLLCWWRLRPGRGFLAAGLLIGVLGQAATLLQAVSVTQVYPKRPSAVVASAVVGALWVIVLLALALLAARGSTSDAPPGPAGDLAALPKLGVVLSVFGTLQFLAAAFEVPSRLRVNAAVSLMPDPRVGAAYAVVSVAAPAVLVVAGSSMWRGAWWASRLAAFGWLGIVVQGLVLIVAGWLVVVPEGAPPGSAFAGITAGAVAPGLFTSAVALLALWVLRAVGTQIRLPSPVGGPPGS